jgi:YVTN family beta-propeller protein
MVIVMPVVPAFGAPAMATTANHGSPTGWEPRSQGTGTHTASVKPYVAETLDLCTGVLYSGNFLPTDCTGNSPQGIAYDSGKGEVFVDQYYYANVAIVNTTTNSVVQTVSVGSYPYGAAYDSGKGEVFVSDYGSQQVSVINDTTNTVVATINVGIEPHGLVYDSAKGEIFVSNFGESNVSVIDDNTNSPIASIQVGTGPGWLAYDSVMSEVFVSNYRSDNVSVISDATNGVVANIPVGSYPAGIGFDSSTGQMFVSNANCASAPCGQGSISVIDDATNSVVVTVDTDASPTDSVHISSLGDMIVADYGSNDVQVMSDSFDNITSTFSTGAYPSFFAFDSVNGYVYLTNGGQGTLSIISTRGGQPSQGTSGVTYTLDLCTDILFSANILPGDCSDYGPQGVALDSGKGEIFVTQYYEGDVNIIDAATNSATRTIAVGNEPYAAGYDSARGEIFVANYGSSDVSVINDSTNTVVATIGTGVEPHSAVYDSAMGEVFVSNFGSANISVISDATNKVVSTIPVGSKPAWLAYDDNLGEMFVTNYGSNNVSVINDGTNTVVANIPVGSNPLGMAYDSGKGEVFVANANCLYAPCGPGTVSVIDAVSNSVVATIDTNPSPTDVAYDGDLGEIFVPNYALGSLSVISDTNNTIVSTMATGTNPSFAVYDTTNGYVYLSNGGQGTISMIATRPAPPLGMPYVVNTIDICSNYVYSGNYLPADCGGNSPQGIALDSAKGELFVAQYAAGNVEIISTTSNNVVGTIATGIRPYAAGYDSAKGEVFIANYGSSDVSVINDTTDKIVATIGVGFEPHSVFYDSARGEIFIGNFGSGNMSVINDTTNGVVATINVGAKPAWMAYDNALSEIFVTNYGSNNVSVINDGTNGVVANIPVGSDPLGIAFDSGKGEVFVANANCLYAPCGPGTVSVIDAATNSVVATVDTDSSPVGLVYDRYLGELLVPNYGSVDMSIISDATNTVTSTLMVGSYPSFTVYDNANNYVYLTNGFQGTVSVISTTILSALTVSPTTAALSPNGTQGFNAAATCSIGGVIGNCPSNAVFTWGLNNTLGSLNSSTGAAVTFSAGSVAGTITLDVTVSIYGQSMESQATITIATITSVSVAPNPASISSGAAQTFNATATCAIGAVGGTCPVAVAYAWELNNTLGSLNSSTGMTVTFTAGSDAGTVSLTVSATAYGQTVTSQATITIVKTITPIPLKAIATNSPPELNGTVCNPFPVTVDFFGSASGGTSPYSFSWAFGDGSAGSLVQDPVHEYSAAGTYNASLTVTDALENSAVAYLTVNIVVSAVSCTPSSNPPAISSVTIDPNPLTLGDTTYINVSATGGTGPLTYTYTGLPTGCTTANVSYLACTPTVSGAFSIGIFVNDSLKESTSAIASLFVYEGNVTITSVKLNPTTSALTTGETQAFVVIPSCSGTCPTGITYSWSLSNSLGILSATSGSTTTFKAGGIAGNDTLFVNATLDGKVVSSSVRISITAIPAKQTGQSNTGIPTWLFLVIVAMVVGAVLAALAMSRQKKQKRLQNVAGQVGSTGQGGSIQSYGEGPLAPIAPKGPQIGEEGSQNDPVRDIF